MFINMYMAQFSPDKTQQPKIETTKQSKEAKTESGKEKPLSEVGRERAERAQQTINKGVEAVKSSIGKSITFLKEKGMAILALDVAVARAGKAAGEFIQKDAAKTLEHAKIAGKFAKDAAKEAAVDIILGPTANLVREAAKEAGRDDVLKFAAEETVKNIKKTGKDIKEGAAAAGKFAVETGKTALEVGVIAGAVGVEVGKFAAKKAAEGAEAAKKFTQEKVEKALDNAQQKYEVLQKSLSRLERQTRVKITESRDRFNAKINGMRDSALDALADAINKGIEAKQNLQTAVDQGRKAAGVKVFEFIKKHNEQRLEDLQAKLSKVQAKVNMSQSMISILSS